MVIFGINTLEFFLLQSFMQKQKLFIFRTKMLHLGIWNQYRQICELQSFIKKTQQQQ